MEQDNKLYYLNRLINCIDPCKDATVKFKNGGEEAELTEVPHGNFLKDNVIIPIFNGNKLNDDDKRRIKGVGNENSAIRTAINNELDLKSLPQQEIIRLKISITKDLRFDKELFLTYDAGPGPDNFSKQYTLILTPGSVIDSAKKGKTHNKLKSFIKVESKLPVPILKNFDLTSSLTGISYKYNGKNECEFEIHTTIPRFEKKNIKFDINTFNEIGTNYFAGNSTKNKYIFENYTKGVETTNEIKFRILAKELGDTLQVAWLKYIIVKGGRDNEFNEDNTAICTCDTALWLRSVLNGVSCIFTVSNTSTFYPVSASIFEGSTPELINRKERRKRNSEALIMKQLEKRLKDNNKEVIKSLEIFKYYIDDITNNYLDFHGKKLTKKIKGLMSGILNDVIKALNKINTDTLNLLISKENLAEYREFVANNLFKSPFRLFGTRDVEHFSTFTHFININGNKRYKFNANLVYRLIYYRDISVAEQIIGGDLTNVVPPPDVSMTANKDAAENVSMTANKDAAENANKQAGGFNEEMNISKDIIKKNINRPGFLSYYTMMHHPEVIYVIYSIATVYNFPAEIIQTYSDLFKSNETNTLLTESFGMLNTDNTYDYTPPKNFTEKLIESDKLFINIYQYLLYFKEESIYKTHNIFNLFNTEINWLLENIDMINIHKVNINTDIFNGNEEEIIENQSLILDVYEELYDAEVYLTTLNMRAENSPVEYIPDIKSYAELGLIPPPVSDEDNSTPVRNKNTKKRSRNVSNNNSYATNNETKRRSRNANEQINHNHTRKSKVTAHKLRRLTPSEKHKREHITRKRRRSGVYE